MTTARPPCSLCSQPVPPTTPALTWRGEPICDGCIAERNPQALALVDQLRAEARRYLTAGRPLGEDPAQQWLTGWYRMFLTMTGATLAVTAAEQAAQTAKFTAFVATVVAQADPDGYARHWPSIANPDNAPEAYR